MPCHDLLIAYDFPPIGGGISRMMAEIASGYPAGSLTVSTGRLEGASADGCEFPNQVDRLGIDPRSLKTIQGRFMWSGRVAQLAREHHANFAWCGNIRPAGYVARRASKRTGLPYGLILYGGDLLQLEPKLQRSALRRFIYRPLFESAAVLVVVSEWTGAKCAHLLDGLGIPEAASKIKVVPLGTSPSRFQTTPESLSDFKNRYGLVSSRWLVTVARLVPHKGIDTGIKVLALIAEEFPDLQYAVVGRGPYLDTLRSLSIELGVAHRVHFLTDVADHDLPNTYSMASVYLGLSREEGLDVEGFGISLLEAAVCRAPVVAGDSGGIPDAVADGISGILVAPEPAEPAAAVVRDLLSNPDKAEAMGRAGYRRVLDSFTWSRVVSDLRSISAEFGRQ